MLFNNLFKKKENIKPQWIIAGLGNPGIQYEITRHNAGFMCVDKIAEKYGIGITDKMFDSLYCFVNIGGIDCILVKPQTYMNNSGIAVKKFARKYDIPAEKIIVISDDVNFDVGKMRIKRSGSSGGQNGLNSIIDHMETEDFPRIKIGVGKKPKEYNMADWVLSNFDHDESENLKPVLEKGCNAVELIISDSIEAAMQKCN